MSESALVDGAGCGLHFEHNLYLPQVDLSSEVRRPQFGHFIVTFLFGY